MNLDMDTTPRAGNSDYNDYLGPVEYQREEMENCSIYFEDVNVNQMQGVKSYHHRYYYLCMAKHVEFTLTLHGQPSIPLNWLQ